MLIKIAGGMKLRVTARIRILNGFVKLEKLSKKDSVPKGQLRGSILMQHYNHLPKNRTESCRIVSNSSEKDLGVKVDHKPTGVSNTIFLRKGNHRVESYEQRQACRRSPALCFFQHCPSAAFNLGYHFSRGT